MKIFLKNNIKYFLLLILIGTSIFYFICIRNIINITCNDNYVYKIPKYIKRSTMEKILLFTSGEFVINKSYNLVDNVYILSNNNYDESVIREAIYNPIIFVYELNNMNNLDYNNLFKGTIDTSKIDIYTVFKYMNINQTHNIYSKYLSSFNSKELNNKYISSVKKEYKNMKINILDLYGKEIFLNIFILMLSILIIVFCIFKLDNIKKIYKDIIIFNVITFILSFIFSYIFKKIIMLVYLGNLLIIFKIILINIKGRSRNG